MTDNPVTTPEGDGPAADTSCQCKGTIINNTSSNMTMKSDDLKHGKWMTEPPGSLSPNTSSNFFAEGRTATLLGVEGTIVYQTEDGTEFSLYFSVPLRKDNAASLTCTSGNAANYVLTLPQVPNKGDLIQPQYTIADYS